MTHHGKLTLPWGHRPGPPRRTVGPGLKTQESSSFLEGAQLKEKKKIPWGKIALGAGSGLAALGAAVSPVGSAFIQEHHLAQCVGLSDPVDLLDLSVDVSRLVGVPGEESTAQQNAEWWKSLSPEKQEELLRESPSVIGNLEGLPSVVKDRANRQTLRSEISRLESVEEDLQEKVKSQGEDVPYTLEAKLPGMRLEAIGERLGDLNRIDTALQGGENRYLLTLDNIDGENVHAAISQGNPDYADHIAVTVPGVNTTVRALKGMLSEGNSVQKEAYRQLQQAGREGETIATVAWTGYDTPHVNGSFCEKVSGGLDAAGTAKARQGAEDLNDFFQGLEASYAGSGDPNVTALGHSYGSLTTSLALQNGGHSVDSFVVYGSPGISLDKFSDLGIEPGQAYEMTARGDKVPELVGKIEWFGEPTKSNPDFVHLSTEPTVIDGLEYEGAYAHADYPHNGTNGRLRVSGYNMASVVAGLPQNTVSAIS